MEDRTGGVERLELVLDVERREDVLGESDGQVRRVGVVGSSAVAGSRDDVGEARDVVLCEAVRRRLGGRSLEVVEVAVELLIVGEALSHMVEHVLCELLSPLVRHVGAEPLRVQTDLVHSDKTDRREVVLERAEVSLRVGVKPFLEELRDDRSLYLQRTRGDVHELVKARVEVLLVRCKICDTGHVYRDNADGACRLTGAEEAAGFLSQFAKVETKPAAHRTDVGGLHVGVDVVREVGGAVLRGHLEKELVVLGLGPVERLRDRIRGDRVLEASSVRVALDHDLDERLVDHVHLGFAVAVGEVHLAAAHDRLLICEVGGNCPVESDVRERSLRAPS